MLNYFKKTSTAARISAELYEAEQDLLTATARVEEWESAKALYTVRLKRLQEASHNLPTPPNLIPSYARILRADAQSPGQAPAIPWNHLTTQQFGELQARIAARRPTEDDLQQAEAFKAHPTRAIRNLATAALQTQERYNDQP